MAEAIRKTYLIETLREKGMRISREAMPKLLEHLKNVIDREIEKLARITSNSKRKTIKAEDIDILATL